MGTRHPVNALDVTLREIPPMRAQYEAFLGCRIRTGRRLTVAFDVAEARRPFLSDNSAMWNVFEPQLRRRISALDGSATFESRTRAALVAALPSGQTSIGFVARRLAVSPRTLQRRLRSEGTSFKAITQAMRLSLSRHYLAQTRLSYSEIAYHLGFNEPSSFHRAFMSWTGTTPNAVRQMLQPVG